MLSCSENVMLIWTRKNYLKAKNAQPFCCIL